MGTIADALRRRETLRTQDSSFAFALPRVATIGKLFFVQYEIFMCV